jgi:flagellar basal-body rod protein FlgB
LRKKTQGPGTSHAPGLGAVIDLFAGVAPLHASLDYHLERQNVLASNIAHVDTPGFHPKDLERVEGAGAFQQVMGVAMGRTNAAHIASDAGTGVPQVGRVFTDSTAGGGADGNYVSLEREAGKLASNQVRYDFVSVIMSSELRGLLWAAQDGKAG